MSQLILQVPSAERTLKTRMTLKDKVRVGEYPATTKAPKSHLNVLGNLAKRTDDILHEYDNLRVGSDVISQKVGVN